MAHYLSLFVLNMFSFAFMVVCLIMMYELFQCNTNIAVELYIFNNYTIYIIYIIHPIVIFNHRRLFFLLFI